MTTDTEMSLWFERSGQPRVHNRGSAVSGTRDQISHVREHDGR